MRSSNGSCLPVTIPRIRQTGPGKVFMSSLAAGGRVERHKLVDRIYHWVMAVSILTLMVTAFLPILGWKFEWLAIHWITGLVLTLLVAFHIIRSLFFQKIMNMVPDGKDVIEPLARPGKYSIAQKL